MLLLPNRPAVSRTVAVLERYTADKQKVADRLAEFKTKWYETHVILVNLPADRAAERLVERFRKTGRFVDPAYAVYSVSDSPLITYN